MAGDVAAAWLSALLGRETERAITRPSIRPTCMLRIMSGRYGQCYDKVILVKLT